jgi:hypothetical protein
MVMRYHWGYAVGHTYTHSKPASKSAGQDEEVVEEELHHVQLGDDILVSDDGEAEECFEDDMECDRFEEEEIIADVGGSDDNAYEGMYR